MTLERAYVPVSELPEEEKSNLEFLETKTDEIYRLRSALADSYRRLRKFLPVASDKHRLRFNEIAQEIAAGRMLDDLIPWDKVDATGTVTLSKQAWHDEVRGEFELALQVFAELKEKKGAWAERVGADTEERDLREFYEMRWRELGVSVRRLDGIEIELKKIDAMLEERRNRIQAEGATRVNLKLVEQYEGQYTELYKELEGIINIEPEAYLYVYGRSIKEAKEIYDTNGRIVETPYVKTKMARIRSLVDGGRPVFIHGELGSGKTELAKHMARRALSEAHLKRWEVAHPAPTDKKSVEFQKWLAERNAQSEALVISGHKGIEIEQILAARAVTRAETISPVEQTKRIADEWEAFKADLPSDADTGKLRSVFERAHLEAFRTPVETRVILAPFLQAMKEGRPVIIDEMNAIPHHVLIVLNDFLTLRPGDMVHPPFPDEKPFPVKEGFSVFATGNYHPEDGKLYAAYTGRQQIDAAFLSRWGIVSYDYLPMERKQEASGLVPEAQRAVREENELYHMLVTRLLADDLSLKIPEGGLEQVRRLAIVARNLQDVFAHGEVNTGYYATAESGAQVKPQEVLKENVLSIRHMLPILDEWKRSGFTRKLDDFLFLNYITRSDARPEEKAYIYQVLNVQGNFFPETTVPADSSERDRRRLELEAWPGIGMDQRKKLLAYPIEEKIYGVDPKTRLRKPLPDLKIKKRYYSAKEVIEALYGPAPERPRVTKRFAERGKTALPPAAEDSAEGELEMLRLLESIHDNAEYLHGEGFVLSVPEKE